MQKKEPAGSSKSPEVSTPPTGSAISISNLLDCVNNYFPDILYESVLKHFENKFYNYNMNLQNKKDKLSLATKVVCSATMYPYIVYSISCKMSIITIQNFLVMLILTSLTKGITM